MATGMSTATCNSILDAIGNATSYSIATPYIQLHVGDPGASGTANTAGNATREDLRAAVANAASGAITSRSVLCGSM